MVKAKQSAQKNVVNIFMSPSTASRIGAAVTLFLFAFGIAANIISCDNGNGGNDTPTPEPLPACDVVWHWSDDTLDATKDHTGCTVVPTATAEHKAGTLRLAGTESDGCYVMFNGARTEVKHDNCERDVPGVRATNGLPITNRNNIAGFTALAAEIDGAFEDELADWGPDELATIKNHFREIATKNNETDTTDVDYTKHIASGKYVAMVKDGRGLDAGAIAGDFWIFVNDNPELFAVLPQLIKIVQASGKWSRTVPGTKFF